MTNVLGGPHDNELHLPAQLLPLLIGTFGFVRISYLVFENQRSHSDIEPSVSAPTTPHQARIIHARDFPLLFSPAMARNPITTSHDPHEIDDLERKRRWPVRYLVAWLPWLSLLGYFHDDPVFDKGKRLGNRNQMSHEFQKVDLAQPPRRGQGIERNPVSEENGGNGGNVK